MFIIVLHQGSVSSVLLLLRRQSAGYVRGASANCRGGRELCQPHVTSRPLLADEGRMYMGGREISTPGHGEEYV